MLLVIDNFDSFTYNLVQAAKSMGADVVVHRNDVPLSTLKNLSPSALLVSPGPCTPNEAGCSVEALAYFSGRIPVLGVCLGHQSLGQVFGGKVIRAKHLMHGKTSMVTHMGDPIFTDVPSPFQATRYHSLIVERETLPNDFDIIASCDEVIMGIRHRPTGAVGLQFHPESILTTHGNLMLRNFLAS